MRTAYPIRFNHRPTAVAGWVLCLLLLFPEGANAGAGNAVQVSDAWVRETVPGQSVGAAYMRIRSKERIDLVRVESAVSKSAELHQMSMQGGVMKMREVRAVKIDPGHELALVPGGTHVMLVDVARPLKPGDEVALKLIFRRVGGTHVAVRVPARVKSMAEAMHAH